VVSERAVESGGGIGGGGGLTCSRISPAAALVPFARVADLLFELPPTSGVSNPGGVTSKRLRICSTLKALIGLLTLSC
jgi:hypothetical protein